MDIKSFQPNVKTLYNRTKTTAHSLFKGSSTPNDKKMVNLGWYHKKDGKLVEAQLPESTMRKIPAIAKGIMYFMMVAAPVDIAKSVAQEASAIAESKANIGKNIIKAKTESMLKDSIVWDSKIPLPYKLSKVVKNPATPVGKFYNSMRENKDSLMKDLKISSADYNQYATVALKLCKEESQYGNALSYKIYDAVESSDLGRNAVSTARQALKGDGDLSMGMTRLKISKVSDEEKTLLDKYGVTYDSNTNIVEPEKSAIATVIHLATLGKDYQKYLENAKALRPDVQSEIVQESLSNAKQVLFDNVRRVKAMALLEGGEQAVEERFADGVYFNIDVSEKDLNDLRTYASTVILSKEAYLAGRWNGRKLLPEGARKDQACVNLLNVAAQKGYLSNIDKTSKVIYSEL